MLLALLKFKNHDSTLHCAFSERDCIMWEGRYLISLIQSYIQVTKLISFVFFSYLTVLLFNIAEEAVDEGNVYSTLTNPSEHVYGMPSSTRSYTVNKGNTLFIHSSKLIFISLQSLGQLIADKVNKSTHARMVWVLHVLCAKVKIMK